nr:DUF5671 domain-containing protein [Caldilineaceae bacterium]
MSTSTSLNPPASAPAGEPVNRLAPIRRLYFYIVALISFSIALVALDALLNYLIGLWLAGEAVATVYDAQYTRRMIAESGGGLLVATPIFLLHWGYMQRHLDEPGERGAGLRKLFLYIVSGIAIGYALVHGYQLLSGLANLAFGEELNANPLWPSDWLYHLAMLVIAVALQSYFHYVLKSDGDYGQEQGLAGTWRRLYQAIAGLVALGLLLLGAADILAAGWDLLTGALANEVTISFGLTRAQLS